MPGNAIVTLAIGEPCISNWKRHCFSRWQAYAQRHDLDHVLITDTLAPLDRPVAWQKCLVLSQPFASKYRQIAIVDADVAVNPTSPNIFEQMVPVDRIGGVICGSHIHDDLKLVLLSRLTRKDVPYDGGQTLWRADQDWCYTECGLTPQPAGIINTGVLVASPTHHAELFRGVYNTPSRQTRQYEQIPLSHAILSAGLFHPIDTRFNSVVFETLLVHHHYLFTQPVGELVTRVVIRSEFLNNFFLHFAYDQTLMRLLED